MHLISLFIFLFPSIIQNEMSGSASDTTCYTVQKVKVEGSSMEGIVSNGDEIMVAKGYYNCNEIQRNDLVIYHYAGMKIPLIKSVCGIPGDSLRIRGENILINGTTVLLRNGMPYVADKGALKMLTLYEHSYNGIIPINAYLLIGNRTGTTDSGRFGFAGKNDILGKAFKPNNSPIPK